MHVGYPCKGAEMYGWKGILYLHMVRGRACMVVIHVNRRDVRQEGHCLSRIVHKMTHSAESERFGMVDPLITDPCQACHPGQCCQLLAKLSGKSGGKIRPLRKNPAPY
jgi:hypothetical protein